MDILSLTEKPQTDKLSICRFDKWWIDCKKDGAESSRDRTTESSMREMVFQCCAWFVRLRNLIPLPSYPLYIL